MEGLHHSVLLEQAITWLAPRDGGFYVDATVGGGGHAEAILDASAPSGRLLGIDRDPSALDNARQRLDRFGDRVQLRHGRASALREVLEADGGFRPQGVLLDLGISAFQLEDDTRGFSFASDGPLDMRMDPAQALTADAMVNSWAEEDLAEALHTWGEEPAARRVAHHVVQSRPIRSASHLAAVVERALGRRPGKRIHPATRTFQALRIVVNDEIREANEAVSAALDCVAPGGRVVAIAFHSLEDRAVKRLFATACGKLTPRDAYGNPVQEPTFRDLTRGAVRGEDFDPHPRARSARLRAVERRSPVQGGMRIVETGHAASPPAPRCQKMREKAGSDLDAVQS